MLQPIIIIDYDDIYQAVSFTQHRGVYLTWNG